MLPENATLLDLHECACGWSACVCMWLCTGKNIVLTHPTNNQYRDLQSSRSMEARLRRNITNILPYSTERGNSKELLGIHGKLRARKKLSLIKTEWLEDAYQNPLLTDSPAGHPTAAEKKVESQKTFYFR